MRVVVVGEVAKGADHASAPDGNTRRRVNHRETIDVGPGANDDLRLILWLAGRQQHHPIIEGDPAFQRHIAPLARDRDSPHPDVAADADTERTEPKVAPARRRARL